MAPRLPEVSPRLAQAYARHLADRGDSAGTRNQKRSAVKTVFDAFVYSTALKQNVWETVPRVEQVSKPKHAFTADEAAKLYKTALTFDSRWDGFWPAAIALSWYTGLRLGDIATLDWTEIDLDTRMLTVIPNKSWRRRRPVVHPIPAEVFPFLREREDKEGHVWPKLAEGYVRTYDPNVFKEFKQLKKAAGFAGKDYGFHGLRRGHVTQLRDLGVALDDIRETVGHANVATTDMYSDSVAAGRRVAEIMPVLVTND